MFSCHKCAGIFEDSNIFLKHLHYSHQSRSSYQCGKDTCSRKFPSFNSLRKHIRTKHADDNKINNHRNVDLIPQSYNRNDSTDDDFTSNLGHFDHKSDVELEENDEYYETNESFNEPTSSAENNVDSFIMFAAKLYSHADVSRTRSQSIINDTRQLIKNTISSIKSDIIHSFNSAAEADDIVQAVTKILDNSSAKFDIQSTEWQCIEHFKRLQTYISPEEILLGERQEYAKRSGKQEAILQSVTAQFIPMRSVFENFFEIPGIFNDTVNNVSTLLEDRSIISNFIQSDLWREIRFLETNGIEINVENKTHKIYFKLILILGDNLGLHSLLGFIESLNAKKFCRFCRLSKSEISTVFDKSQCSVRNKENYAADLLKNNPKVTGIVEECIFHKIADFHVTKNISVDIMHDTLEGIGQYDFGLIIHAFTKIKIKISLQELNTRLRAFNYGKTKNKPPEILETQLKQHHLIMSASAMRCLIWYFSLIVGPFIPDDDEVWDLYLQLRELVEMLTTPKFHCDIHHVIQLRIQEYLQSLVQVFPNSMKPKHHFLVHYSRVFVMCGPLWNLSSIRYESKHREAKITSRVSISRVNVCRTVAIKHQLRFC